MNRYLLVTFALCLLIRGIAPACELETAAKGVKPFDVRTVPDPVLRQMASPVDLAEISTPEFNKLIVRMVATLDKSEGIGIAAPQVGISSQIFLVRILTKHLERHSHMNARPLTVVINPEIEVVNETLLPYREGCLSIPGFSGIVQRPRHIRIRYVDMNGNSQEEEINSLNAIVFLHENDHLVGRLISDYWIDVEKR